MRRASGRIRLMVLVGTLAGLALPLPAAAQYFGRNKVQYDRFDFQVLQTEHFDVHYYPREKTAAEAAARMASGYYGAFPVDFTIFGDGGVAWESDIDPSFAGGDREPVFSTGVGLRFNLLGFAIGEVNLVHPFDRPQRDWVWEFNLQPGF